MSGLPFSFGKETKNSEVNFYLLSRHSYFLFSAEYLWIGGKYTGNIVFTNGSSYVATDNQRHNNWCYSIADNNQVDGKACSNRFPFICQKPTGTVCLLQ